VAEDPSEGLKVTPCRGFLALWPNMSLWVMGKHKGTLNAAKKELNLCLSLPDSSGGCAKDGLRGSSEDKLENWCRWGEWIQGLDRYSSSGDGQKELGPRQI
jgi:hypothetical protein